MTTLVLRDLHSPLSEEKQRYISDAVRERCKTLGLSSEDTWRCIKSAVTAAHNGTSTAIAIENGKLVAERIAHPNGVRGKKAGAPLPGAA